MNICIVCRYRPFVCFSCLCKHVLLFLCHCLHINDAHSESTQVSLSPRLDAWSCSNLNEYPSRHQHSSRVSTLTSMNANCHIAMRTTSFRQSALSVKGATLWNCLATKLVMKHNFTVFNRDVRLWLKENVRRAWAGQLTMWDVGCWNMVACRPENTQRRRHWLSYENTAILYIYLQNNFSNPKNIYTKQGTWTPKT